MQLKLNGMSKINLFEEDLLLILVGLRRLPIKTIRIILFVTLY